MSTTIEQDIAVIRKAAQRLVALTDAPEPGLFTWVEAVGRQLKILAEVRGNDTRPHKDAQTHPKS